MNGLDKADWEEGASVVEILIDAGCDTRYVIIRELLEGLPQQE